MTFDNLNNDTIQLLKDFFETLLSRINNQDDIEFIKTTLIDVKNLPNAPAQNTCISLEDEDVIFYVSLNDYKIELSHYLLNYYEDENGIRSNHETIQSFCFRFEIDGYIDITGDFDYFREMLLTMVKNVSLIGISISDEE